MKNSYYLTTAIDYVNATPHVGTAYEKIGADARARFMRLQGIDTFFLMGVDEHSANVERQAKEAGLTAREYCDRMVEKFIAAWKALGISYDRFIRTSEPAHAKAVSEIFRRIHEKGDIYKGKYKGWYCVSCEAFLKESELSDGLCPSHGKKPEWIEEENYFFALSRYRDALERHIAENEEFIGPATRRNEVLSFLSEGLEDISVSRSGVAWGIRCPFDETQAVYVWFDALINYVTGAGFLQNDEAFRKWWPADLHVIGKDIIRFHCVIWPAMLMAAGLPLPKSVWAHGFVHLGGEKMSKTSGKTLDPLALAGEYGADALRYFLLREVPFDRDGDFTMKRFLERYNADLANALGNLCQRTLVMVKKYLGGEIPAGTDAGHGQVDEEMKTVLLGISDSYCQHMKEMRFHLALDRLWGAVFRCNQYIDETAPWKLRKEPEKEARFRTVVYNLCESLRVISILVSPVMPGTAAAIRQQLGLSPEIAPGSFEETKTFGLLQPGTPIGEVSPLFPKKE